MKLIPSGNRRIMVAQLNNPSGIGIDFGNGVEPVSAPVNVPDIPVSSQEGKKEDSEDLTQYVFNKLVGFGYPPRRLDGYEEKFVHEKITRDGGRDVTVVIPDRYYGSKKSLSRKDFVEIVNEVQYGFVIDNKVELAQVLLKKFDDAPPAKDFVRMDLDKDTVKYFFYDTYEEAYNESIGLNTPDYHTMAIVSKGQCVFLDGGLSLRYGESEGHKG